MARQNVEAEIGPGSKYSAFSQMLEATLAADRTRCGPGQMPPCGILPTMVPLRSTRIAVLKRWPSGREFSVNQMKMPI